DAVAVHVATTGDPVPELIPGARAAHEDARVEIEDDVDHRRRIVGPEDDVALAGEVTAERIGHRRSDDEVGKAVAVEVAGARDARAEEVPRLDTVHVDAAINQRVDVDLRGKVRASQDDVDHAGPPSGAAHRSSDRRHRSAFDRTDRDVIEAVAVEVADPRYRPPEAASRRA